MNRHIAIVTAQPRQGRQNLAHGVRVCVRTRHLNEESTTCRPCCPRNSLISRSRHEFSHGLVSRGVASAAPSPCPLPRSAGGGDKKGVGAVFPRALALGYYLPPLLGLVRLAPRITATGQ